jgi:ribosomal protein S18 acetylase RimI-like enzyme
MADPNGTITEHAQSRDLDKMAEIFIASLPGHQLSLLGLPVCREFLLHTLDNDAFITVTARKQGHPVGFLVLNVDVTRKPSRIYYYRHWQRLAGAILRRPVLLPKWSFAVMRGSWRRCFSSRRHRSRNGPSIEQSAWMEYVVVSSPHRRQGVATALIRYALDLAASRGKEAIYLGTSRENRVAIDAYLKVGFREVEDGRNPGEFIYMEIPVVAEGRKERRQFPMDEIIAGLHLKHRDFKKFSKSLKAESKS